MNWLAPFNSGARVTQSAYALPTTTSTVVGDFFFQRGYVRCSAPRRQADFEVLPVYE